MNVLIMMSGSIACAKASGLISALAKKGHQIKVVATESALNFIGKATLEGLSGHTVYDSTFAEGEMMEHIHLSRWADRIVIAPATANTLNKIANGIADDILTSTWIAAMELKKPMYIAPAMNAMMWNYPATQSSIQLIQKWGVEILYPGSGELACGENDVGRLMEVEQMESLILNDEPHLKRLKILITAGGTREYIDGVRYIGNLSSGKTSAEISDYFVSQGHEVVWLGAKSAIKPKRDCKKIEFDSFADLQKELKETLANNEFDLMIHAAAVSDYSVSAVIIDGKEQEISKNTKLPTEDTIHLVLNKNPKLIREIKNWSKKKEIKLLGFKLTNTKDESKKQYAVEKLLSSGSIDFVAYNDLSDITESTHEFRFYESANKFTHCKSTVGLCEKVEDFMEKNE